MTPTTASVLATNHADPASRSFRSRLATAPALALLLVLVLATASAASAFDLERARTEAEVVDPGAEHPAVQIELRAALRGALPELGRADLVATWEQAGGISPTPFIVTLPAGCMVPNERGFHVDDFRTCGASAELGGAALTLIVLEARWITTGDGTSRLDLSALFAITPDDSAPVLLGALGGATVEVAVGTASSLAPPLEVETLSGIDPQPF